MALEAEKELRKTLQVERETALQEVREWRTKYMDAAVRYEMLKLRCAMVITNIGPCIMTSPQDGTSRGLRKLAGVTTGEQTGRRPRSFNNGFTLKTCPCCLKTSSGVWHEKSGCHWISEAWAGTMHKDKQHIVLSHIPRPTEQHTNSV